MTAFYLSAAHKSSGKTSISIGLAAALGRKSYTLQAFKKGPDYIDPMWLSLATRQSTYNLDFYTQSHHEIESLYKRHSFNKDISLVEGNMGLFDGISLHGGDCNAAMAKLLDLPVVLVVDANGMSRNVAALVMGMQVFDPELKFAGVILNKVANDRHSKKLISSIECYTDLKVLGSVGRNERIAITERHLGLVPTIEQGVGEELVNALADVVESEVDLDFFEPTDLVSYKQSMSAKNIVSLNCVRTKKRDDEKQSQVFDSDRLRIGIAKDSAFGFYYADDIEQFKNQNAEIVPINLLEDTCLPKDLDALFIGGGFPETHLKKLAANKTMISSIKQAVEAWLPVYAECGGLMYLSKQITWQSETHKMVGAIPGDSVVHSRPVGKGYIKLKSTENHLWASNYASKSNEKCHYTAHEFHYSELVNLPKDSVFAFEVERGYGINGTHDGYVYKNLLANYGHLRNLKRSPWVKQFIQFIKAKKASALNSEFAATVNDKS